MDIKQSSLELHKRLRGKIEIKSKFVVQNKEDLSLVYTPGVAEVSKEIAKDKKKVFDYTLKGNTVAVISDGSAVLGLGNIGAEAALPVMEGKCLIFKQFADINAFPIVLSTQDPEEIIKTVIAIAPTFGAINLEDIASPQCFLIEKRLQEALDIPIWHDDQWGAATAVLAGLINALKVANKTLETANIVILGAGASGNAVALLLSQAGAKHIVVCDQQGIIYKNRSGLEGHKIELAELTNLEEKKGSLGDACHNADVLIGLAKANTVTSEMIESMNKNAIVFALSNPDPEISRENALAGGAFIYASGRSDQVNQINNALVYPGIFRGALDHHITKVTPQMFIQAAYTLAGLIMEPSVDEIIPSIFEKDIVSKISEIIR